MNGPTTIPLIWEIQTVVQVTVVFVKIMISNTHMKVSIQTVQSRICPRINEEGRYQAHLYNGLNYKCMSQASGASSQEVKRIAQWLASHEAMRH